MQSGASQLAEWIRKRNEKKADVAKQFGITAGYLSMFLSGERSPGRDLACLIHELTGIPVNAWSSSELHESELVVVSSGSKQKRNKA